MKVEEERARVRVRLERVQMLGQSSASRPLHQRPSPSRARAGLSETEVMISDIDGTKRQECVETSDGGLG